MFTYINYNTKDSRILAEINVIYINILKQKSK